MRCMCVYRCRTTNGSKCMSRCYVLIFFSSCFWPFFLQYKRWAAAKPQSEQNLLSIFRSFFWGGLKKRACARVSVWVCACVGKTMAADGINYCGLDCTRLMPNGKITNENDQPPDQQTQKKKWAAYGPHNNVKWNIFVFTINGELNSYTIYTYKKNMYIAIWMLKWFLFNKILHFAIVPDATCQWEMHNTNNHNK